jgi:hypothetical protein
MKATLLKTVFIFLLFVIGNFNAGAQITIYDTPCKGSGNSDTKNAMINIAKYGEADNPRITIEPNSSRDRLDIKLDDTENWDLLIFNCDGQLVRLGLLNPGKNKVSLSELSPGTYYVYMSNGDDRWVKKVKKE